MTTYGGVYRGKVENDLDPMMKGRVQLSVAAIDHYRRVCDGYRERGVEPIVSFHHFTTPRWLAAKGGWERPETADTFARFCEWSAARLGDSMARACTINEPNIVSFMGWAMGMFPPGSTEMAKVPAINRILVDAHRKAVDAIRAGAPGVPVGLTLSVRCPQCGSLDTRESSRFGSTSCKSLWVCRACREPFDHFKAL